MKKLYFILIFFCSKLIMFCLWFFFCLRFLPCNFYRYYFLNEAYYLSFFLSKTTNLPNDISPDVLFYRWLNTASRPAVILGSSPGRHVAHVPVFTFPGWLDSEVSVGYGIRF